MTDELVQLDALVKKIAWDTLRKMPGHPMWELEDLVQQGWMTVFKAKTKFKPSPNTKFITYVYRALVNMQSNILRDVYRRPHIPAEMSENRLEGLTEGFTQGVILAALNKLRKGAKETLEALLFRAEKPTVGEVMKLTGRTRREVVKHFKQIRELLESNGRERLYVTPAISIPFWIEDEQTNRGGEWRNGRLSRNPKKGQVDI